MFNFNKPPKSRIEEDKENKEDERRNKSVGGIAKQIAKQIAKPIAVTALAAVLPGKSLAEGIKTADKIFSDGDGEEIEKVTTGPEMPPFDSFEKKDSLENQDVRDLRDEITKILKEKINLGNEEEYNKLSIGLMGHISRLSGITGIYNDKFPNKDTGYSVEAGPGVSADIEYAPNKYLSFRGSIGTRELGVHYNETGINIAKLKMAELDAIFRLLPNEEVKPYIYAGGGIDMVGSDNPVSPQLEGNKFGGHFNLGAGVETDLGKVDGLGDITGRAEVGYVTSTGNKWDGNFKYNEAKGLFHDNGDSFYNFGAGISIALKKGEGKPMKIEIPLEVRKKIFEKIQKSRVLKKEVVNEEPEIIVVEISPDTIPTGMNVNRIETKNMEGIGGSIYFDFDKDKYDLEDPNRPAPVALIKNIEYIANQMKTEYKDSELELSGHADSRGTEKYNLKLSGRRAETVKRELVKLGINPTRIKIEALGENPEFQEIPNASTEREHSFNRFVSFTLMKEKKKENNK